MTDPVSPDPAPKQPADWSGRNRPTHRRWLLGAAGLLTAVTVALVARSALWRPDSTPNPDLFPLPPLSESPFLNTRADAHYVGSDACRGCHKDEHASFRTTGMGCSMADANAAQEPPDATFDHAPSRRRYQVYRQDGRLRHRESLLTEGPQEVVLADYPVTWVVGSGRHTRSYLVEVDGFLVESPLTWYRSRRAWGMSPGYDDPAQPGFQRGVEEGCLICHAGKAEPVGQSWHRMRITEAAIGCERCHGPGSVHVAHQQERRPAHDAAGTVDYTIVNPARLSRELAEAVCQQCHLRPAAVVPARGRALADYRPGLPLQDFLQTYTLETANRGMTVVGHVEQMHLSRCYQGSDRFSCLTCHNPHFEPRPEDRVAFYQSICLECHRPESCKVTEPRRKQDSPANDCVHCHMPRSPTDIPHLAFTHHRIAVHDRPAAAEKVSAPRVTLDLRPFFDLSRLGDIERKRSLGLGYLSAAEGDSDAGHKARYQEPALELLTEVRQAGMRDSLLDASLASLHYGRGQDDFMSYAESALADPKLPGRERCNLLFLVADSQVRRGLREEAAQTLRQLTQLRRHPVDWLLLAECEGTLGNQAAGEEALATAVRINPRLWAVHRQLAEIYRRQGKPERAAWHEQRAVP